MSEIKRTNERETYSITVDWLSEFANKVASGSVPPSPFSSTAAKEKFATIEDKMVDIRKRVGFDSIKKISDKSLDDNKVAVSSKKCNCSEKCSCKDGDRIKSLNMILGYISDMITAEPHLLLVEVVARCKENKELNYDSTRIRQDKINKFIKKLKNKTPKSESEIRYMKNDNLSSHSSEDIADYYQHGLPTSN